MKRKAFLFNSVMIIMGIVGFVATLVPALNLVFNLNDDAQVKSGLIYNGGVQAEKVLNAPCATESPGVFYSHAIQSGDFKCIGTDKMLLRIEYPGSFPDIGVESNERVYYYEIYHDNETSTTTVSALPEDVFDYMVEGSWTDWTEDQAVDSSQWNQLDGDSKFIVRLPALSKDTTTGQTVPIWIEMVIV